MLYQERLKEKPDTQSGLSATPDKKTSNRRNGIKWGGGQSNKW